MGRVGLLRALAGSRLVGCGAFSEHRLEPLKHLLAGPHHYYAKSQRYISGEVRDQIQLLAAEGLEPVEEIVFSGWTISTNKPMGISMPG